MGYRRTVTAFFTRRDVDCRKGGGRLNPEMELHPEKGGRIAQNGLRRGEVADERLGVSLVPL